MSLFARPVNHVEVQPRVTRPQCRAGSAAAAAPPAGGRSPAVVGRPSWPLSGPTHSEWRTSDTAAHNKHDRTGLVGGLLFL